MRMPDDSLKPPCPRDGARSYLAIYPISRLFASLLGFSILLACGCTTPLQYVRNGFKVGPNYEPPDVPGRETVDRCRRCAYPLEYR